MLRDSGANLVSQAFGIPYPEIGHCADLPGSTVPVYASNLTAVSLGLTDYLLGFTRVEDSRKTVG